MSSAEALTSNRCSIPDELESARGKLVYLYLSVRTEADLEQIADDLHLPLITVCDLLSTLERRGVLEGDGDRYRCVA